MIDPVKLEIYKNLFHAVAEEMGAALRRTAFSPNIKERRDYSCAVFDREGAVIAMGDHMPVHLGSMPMSVAAAIAALALGRGDIAMLNDPFAGGTHLPDITLVMPVFSTGRGPRATDPLFYVASRAHHADVGGAQPGSMGLARDIYQEGIRIPPLKIVQRGRLRRDVLQLLLANVRTPVEREGDLTAQVAACRLGARRLAEMVRRYGVAEVRAYMGHLLDYSERMMRATLRAIPAGSYAAEDFLDDDGITPDPVRIRVRISVRGGHARVDFTGSSPQTAGSVNAVRAITVSAVFYVFRCLVPGETPATAGLLRPIEVITPPRSVVNAEPPAAVAAGNVETSQRIVDTLLRALAKAIPERIPAASQGTMNNFTVGGVGPDGQPFAYYETIAGGMGARSTADGLDGIHTHMTNSLNTPVEALESFYPLRVRCYGLRRNSGGRGRHRGGDGVVREIELLTDAQVAILSDRRHIAPYGLAGGRPGKRGRNIHLQPGGKEIPLLGKCTLNAHAGDVIRIETPGGGGWGKEDKSKRGRTEGN
ncbi:MAG TPA: hydantoinase B/oxoprolinase family protein [Candidatus Acidoferrales bacterium]|nr:hydantoinase B/oxoprolinase family protein [Candidatus Acidoferrales bacterium]